MRRVHLIASYERTKCGRPVPVVQPAALSRVCKVCERVEARAQTRTAEFYRRVRTTRKAGRR